MILILFLISPLCVYYCTIMFLLIHDSVSNSVTDILIVLLDTVVLSTCSVLRQCLSVELMTGEIGVELLIRCTDTESGRVAVD